MEGDVPSSTPLSMSDVVSQVIYPNPKLEPRLPDRRRSQPTLSPMRAMSSSLGYRRPPSLNLLHSPVSRVPSSPTPPNTPTWKASPTPVPVPVPVPMPAPISHVPSTVELTTHARMSPMDAAFQQETDGMDIATAENSPDPVDTQKPTMSPANYSFTSDHPTTRNPVYAPNFAASHVGDAFPPRPAFKNAPSTASSAPCNNLLSHISSTALSNLTPHNSNSLKTASSTLSNIPALALKPVHSLLTSTSSEVYPPHFIPTASLSLNALSPASSNLSASPDLFTNGSSIRSSAHRISYGATQHPSIQMNALSPATSTLSANPDVFTHGSSMLSTKTPSRISNGATQLPYTPANVLSPASSTLSANPDVFTHRSSLLLSKIPSTVPRGVVPLSSIPMNALSSSSSTFSSMRPDHLSSASSVLSSITYANFAPTASAIPSVPVNNALSPVSSTLSPADSNRLPPASSNLHHNRSSLYQQSSSDGTNMYCTSPITFPSKLSSSHVHKSPIPSPRSNIAFRPAHKIRKKAVLIGITYVNDATRPTMEDHGEAVQRWFNILILLLDYKPKNICVLSDIYINNATDARVLLPVAANIRKAMKWATEGVGSGDRVLFVYNGEVNLNVFPSAHGEEEKRYSFVGMDHRGGSPVLESELEDMVLRLPRGVSMTMVLDTNWSWNLVRLPYIYLPFKLNKKSGIEMVGALTPESWEMPQLTSLASKVVNSVTRKGQERQMMERRRQEEYMQERILYFQGTANVLCFATSPTKYKRFKLNVAGSSALKKGEYSLALVTVVESIVRFGRPLELKSTLVQVAGILSPQGTMRQMPQLCSTHSLDLTQRFLL